MIELYQYQKEILERSKDNNYFAWFMETGTGKTIVALENIKYLYENKKIEAAIIAAPKTVCRSVWIAYLDKFYRELDYYTFQWIGGMSDHQERILGNIIRYDDSNKLLIFLINIEAFSHKRVYTMVERVMKKYSNIFMIDESTTIKSPKTHVTKGVLYLSILSNYKRILSGYPVLKSPEDLYTQIIFLSRDAILFKSYYAFRNEFCKIWMQGRIPIVKGYQNLDKLSKLIEPFSVRILKKDCLDLPDKVREVRIVEMEKTQAEYYKQVKEDGYTKIKNSDKSVFATTLLTQVELLHQIANGVLRTEPLPTYKYRTVIDIIENELIDNQVVIWSSYVYPIRQLHTQLLNAHISSKIMIGDTSERERVNAIKDFAAGHFQVFIVNSRFRFGLDFTCAHYAIYLNNAFHLEYRIQSEDRLHRIGQINKVTYIDLVTENTIEERILKTLEKKHSIGAEILKDEWEEWFK